MRIVAFCFLAALLLADSAGADPAGRICSNVESAKAEDGLAAIATWDQLHAAYRRFGQCDDGAIAEGYSDIVAYLLTNKWSTIDRFSALSRKDADFERFVLRHIDETLSPDDAAAIHHNACKRCPIGVGETCGKIRDTEAELARYLLKDVEQPCAGSDKNCLKTRDFVLKDAPKYLSCD